MSGKIKIAFIKFGGMAAGGTERWLQIMAANLPKDKFDIDYYYCDAKPYIDRKDSDTCPDRLKYMQENNVNLIKFEVKGIDSKTKTYNWIESNFWDIFDETKYDLIQTAKAGPEEYPYFLLKKPIIEFVALEAGVDFERNIAYSFHPSAWQRKEWLKKGGNPYKSCVIPVPVSEKLTNENLREELDIPDDAIVAGYHQRNSDYIYSPIPLNAFSKIESENKYFIILGGSNKYREQAESLNLKNIRFIEHSGDSKLVSKFLNTLDIFAHGRYDGETYGTVFAEALMHRLPCLSHQSYAGANAHKDTMGPCGLWALNENDYVQKLRELYESKDLRDDLSKNARDFAEENYSLKQCINKSEKIYDSTKYKNKISMKERFFHLTRFMYKFYINQFLRHPKIIFNIFKRG